MQTEPHFDFEPTHITRKNLAYYNSTVINLFFLSLKPIKQKAKISNVNKYGGVDVAPWQSTRWLLHVSTSQGLLSFS